MASESINNYTWADGWSLIAAEEPVVKLVSTLRESIQLTVCQAQLASLTGLIEVFIIFIFTEDVIQKTQD